MKKSFVLILILILGFDVDAKVLTGNTSVEYSGLPEKFFGKFPIEMPLYDGQVKQLQLIDSRRIIVDIYDLPEIIAQIDLLSTGKLVKIDMEFDAGREKDGKGNWKLQKIPGQIRNAFERKVREDGGELELTTPAPFILTGPGYGSGVKPSRVTKVFLSLGGKRVPGSHEVDYAHQCILEFEKPFVNGGHYKISVKNRGSASFVYDEMKTVSRAIKVNQTGYLSDSGSKFAYLGACGYELGPFTYDNVKEFYIVDVATGAKVFTGNVTLRERDPRFIAAKEKEQDTPLPSLYGEDVYELDFTELKDNGTFFISIPGVGRSWPFRHSPDAYGEAFYTAMRGFFHQRCGIDITKDKSAWMRVASPTHSNVYECGHIFFIPPTASPKGYDRFDVIGGSFNKSNVTENVTGGWHDAADWDRNMYHMNAVFDFLYAYECNPATFTDGQLNIPESGNGIPDILDEARWGLECWRIGQSDGGGVSGMIETWTHPGYISKNNLYAFSRRTTWNSLLYSAAAAQYSRLVAKYNTRYAKLYSDSAQKAWEFGINPENQITNCVIKARKKRGQGDEYELKWNERPTDHRLYAFGAAQQLYKLTGKAEYLDYVVKSGLETDKKLALPFPYDWPFTQIGATVWFGAEVAMNNEGTYPAELVEKYRSKYLKQADIYISHLAEMPYRLTWPRNKNYWAAWGASYAPNFNRILYVAWKVTGDRKYRDAIENNADFVLGANPLGMSWTTGIGYVYPIDFQHSISENDGIMDPVPGITIYGITGAPGLFYTARNYLWSVKGPDGKETSFISDSNRTFPFFRAWSTHPTRNTGQCEFTISETMASIAFTTAILLEPGWVPDIELKCRGPRSDEYLFGYWPLP